MHNWKTMWFRKVLVISQSLASVTRLVKVTRNSWHSYALIFSTWFLSTCWLASDVSKDTSGPKKMNSLAMIKHSVEKLSKSDETACDEPDSTHWQLRASHDQAVLSVNKPWSRDEKQKKKSTKEHIILHRVKLKTAGSECTNIKHHKNNVVPENRARNYMWKCEKVKKNNIKIVLKLTYYLYLKDDELKIIKNKTLTRHKASISMYSITFCVRTMLSYRGMDACL